MNKLHDVHTHLTHPLIKDRVEDIIQRAKDAGLKTIISNGLNYSDNLAVLALAKRFSDIVKPAFGLYPVDAVLDEMTQAGIEYPRDPGEIRALDTIDWIDSHRNEAIAIGEVGLDGKWVPEEFWKLQEGRFIKLIEIAIDADLPLIIHSRKRELRCFEICQELKVKKAIFHAYSSKMKLAKRIAAAGYYLSVPANACRSIQYGQMLTALPQEKLLLETDAPYLSPDRENIDPNEPATVSYTVDYAANVWKKNKEEVSEIFNQNFEAIFG